MTTPAGCFAEVASPGGGLNNDRACEAEVDPSTTLPALWRHARWFATAEATDSSMTDTEVGSGGPS